MADLDDLVSMLKAAGEGTRMRLLALLCEGEQSVKDLTEILGQSQPRVSRHLKLLADAALVRRNAEGAWAYYGLAERGPGSELSRWLVERLDPSDPQRIADRARLESARKAQQAQAAEYFAKVAASWDLQRMLHVPETSVEEAILALLGARRLELVLDLGTGTGRMLELLSDHYTRAIGVDSSRDMLRVARSRLADAGIGHAQIRLADISALDPGIGPADLVVMHQVMHYFDDPGRLLAQVRPVLSPLGEVVIVDFAPHNLEFLRTEHAHRRLGLSIDQMEGWARAAGMRVATLKEFPSTNGAMGLTVCLWHLVCAPDQEGKS